jgi:hypothetical protein
MSAKLSRTCLSAAVIAAAAMGLGGCATAAKPEAMIVKTQSSDKAFPPSFLHAMCVRNVTGGEKTNALWVSKVDNDGFRSALNSSLTAAGLNGTSDPCPYPIDVNLLGLSQPSIGFDMTVTAHVNYKVYDSKAQPVLLETIDSPFTATVGDAFIGAERLRLANEGAIRTSIQSFFDKLKDAKPAVTASAQ